MVRTFPDFERYNLISQLLRCSVSIPSNIAEGTSKSTDKHLNKYVEDSWVRHLNGKHNY
ncbi:four helix bundle protein [Cerina litoralis]|nr:four helix bundle protein [Cerina litoralis]